jgi:hypothetical protein
MTTSCGVGSSGIGSVISGTIPGSLIQSEQIKNKVILQKNKGDFQEKGSGDALAILIMNNYIKERLPVINSKEGRR